MPWNFWRKALQSLYEYIRCVVLDDDCKPRGLFAFNALLRLRRSADALCLYIIRRTSSQTVALGRVRRRRGKGNWNCCHRLSWNWESQVETGLALDVITTRLRWKPLLLSCVNDKMMKRRLPESRGMRERERERSYVDQRTEEGKGREVSDTAACWVNNNNHAVDLFCHFAKTGPVEDASFCALLL